MFLNRPTMREQNENLIIEYIANHKPSSRMEISDKIGLNKASVSEIVKNLLNRHFIEEIGSGESTVQGGRRPIMLQLNKKAGFVLSIDLGYNYIDILGCYLNGESWERKLYPFRDISRSSIVSDLKSIITDFMKHAPETVYGLTGITVAIHGMVFENAIYFTPYYDLQDLPIAEALSEHFDVPVFLENEANLLALADHACTDTLHNIISVSVHSGVGAGIILDDQLYRGEKGLSGEIGHMVVVPNGLSCPCGNHGCLEQYCSEKVLLDHYRHRTGNAEAIIPDICHAYHNGEQPAVQLIHEMIQYMAIAMNNIAMLYNPETIFINSEVSRLIPSFTDKIQQQLSSFIAEKVKVRQSVLGEKAILFGGAALATMNFLNISRMRLEP